MSVGSRQERFDQALTVGSTRVWKLKRAPHANPFFFDSGAAVCADGAPNAYGPVGLPTLDYLANAGHPGNWYGVVTDAHGHPVVQDGLSAAQPNRGFYISQTTLGRHGHVEADVRKWVDATTIPFIALPPVALASTGIRLGDIGLLINCNSGKSCFAVFADTKGENDPHLGEISICASEWIGGPTDARHGSIPRGVFTMMFPRSGEGQGHVPDPDTIDNRGRTLLSQFALQSDSNGALPNAYPEYPAFAEALAMAGYPRPAMEGPRGAADPSTKMA